MIPKKTRAMWAMLSLWALPALSQSQKKLSLEEALQHFLEDSPYVSSQIYRVSEAEKAAASSFGRLLPRLDLTANYTQGMAEPLFEDDRRIRDYAVVLRQPLFAGGEIYHSWQASRSASETIRSDSAFSIQTLKLELIQAYLAVLSRDEILRRQLEQVQVLENQLAVVQTRFEAGAAILSDIRQAEARLAGSRGAAVLAESQLHGAKANFQRLTGLDPTDALSWPTPPETLPASVDDMFQEALQSNASLAAARFSIDQQKATKSALRSQYLPEFAAELRVGRRHEAEVTQNRQEFVIGMNMNIFSGLRTHHDIARQDFALRRAMEELGIVKRRLRSESEEVFSAFRASRSNLESLESAVTAAEEATRAFQIEYQSGTRSLSDLLNAEQDLLQSQVGLIQAKFDYLLSAFRIHYVIGSL